MLIRYPGSKDKHIKFLSPYLLEAAAKNPALVEPFAGTASITFYLLKEQAITSYLINDLDESLRDMWRVVRSDPQYLIDRINSYTPTVEDFYLFKEQAGDDEKERAFRKIALHQMSFSGLGAMAGGPLGGRAQKSAYTVDCRWSPRKLTKTLAVCSDLLNSVPGEITSDDFLDVVNEHKADKFLYLDPPYYVKGAELYTAGTLDHASLAEALKDAPTWVLSYDDVPQVRDLYSFADVKRLDVRSHIHHKVIGDVVILPAR